MRADAADRKRAEEKLDITERKRAEEALREKEADLRALSDDLRRSEERYRLLFERSFVGIFRTRADGILVECNDAFARILGYRSAAEAHGHDVLEHYATSSDRDTIVAKISVGEDVDAEVVGQRRDGSPVPVAMSIRRVVDHDGAVPRNGRGICRRCSTCAAPARLPRTRHDPLGPAGCKSVAGCTAPQER